MTENEINVEEIVRSLIGKNSAKIIFDEINKFEDEVVVNFQAVFHCGLLFVKEYLLLKEESDLKITEKLYGAKEVFDFVEKIGYHCSDNEFLQKIIDYDLKSI